MRSFAIVPCRRPFDGVMRPATSMLAVSNQLWSRFWWPLQHAGGCCHPMQPLSAVGLGSAFRVAASDRGAQRVI